MRILIFSKVSSSTLHQNLQMTKNEEIMPFQLEGQEDMAVELHVKEQVGEYELPKLGPGCS